MIPRANKSIGQTDPRAAVAAIRAAGWPNAQMPRLRELLRGAADAVMQVKLGKLCRTINREHYLAEGGSEIKIAVTGNFSCQAIDDLLRTRLLGRGLLPAIHMCDYNQYSYDLLDQGSALYRFQPDLTLCLLDEHCVLDEMPDEWHPGQFSQALVVKLAQLTDLAERYGQHGSGLLVFNTIALSGDTLRQRLDYRGRARISRAWAEFNAGLCALAERLAHVFILDTHVLLADGVALRNARLSFYAKLHLGDELLAAIATEVADLAMARAGKARKCLVLDLDNTLWGGVLGDDGIDGIELSNSAAGEAFVAFQRVIRRLATQGVLLVVSSKNDDANVRRLLAERTDMVLKEDDFAAIYVGWEPKSAALAEIAGSLNIDSDSLVFVDDSAFERAEVGAAHPDVEILALGEEPAEHVGVLLRAHAFEQLELNHEDYLRRTRYKTEAKRQDLLKNSGSADDFLRGLALTLRLFPPGEGDLPRVSQLTLRTNQFNLTTQRMTEPEVRRYLDQPGHGIVAMHCEDRFGDQGLSGCVFYRVHDDVLHIDNFLLSCRVFSRAIETAALLHLLGWAKRLGCSEASAWFVLTAKNGNFATFYDRHGFEVVQEGDTTSYRHALDRIGLLPDHLRIVATYQEQYTCLTN